MDIVDTQSHLGPGGIDQLLAAMNALGIKGCMIDEAWFGFPGEMPTYTLAAAGGGKFRRLLTPTAELAALTHPGRISFLRRVDRRDPELGSLDRLMRDAPGGLALRVGLGLEKAEMSALASGGYDAMFKEAADCGLPIFVTIPGNAPALRAAAEKFPGLTFIIDHCGMPFTQGMQNALKAGGFADALPDMGGGSHKAEFEKVLKLADLPNIALKWGHAPGLFEVSGYPLAGLRPYLRSAFDAFGSERVMWAGDASVNMTGESWAQLLFWIMDNPDITQAERANFLAGSARKILNWPA